MSPVCAFERASSLSYIDNLRPKSEVICLQRRQLAQETLLYIMVALSVVVIISPSELAASGAPLADVVHKVWPRASSLVGAMALFATANTVLITIVAASRLAYSMGRAREIPALFSRLLPSRRTPWAAALLVLAISAALLPIGGIETLAEVSSLSALLAFIAVNIALIVLRYRMPERPRPFRTPLNAGRFPILPPAAIVSIGFLLPYFHWKIYGALVLAILLLSLALFWRRYQQSRSR